MFVSDLMTAPAVTVSPRASIKAAARLLRDRNVAAVPVVDDAGALVGVVSEIDLLRGTVLPDPAAHLLPVAPPADEPPRTVADVMTTDVQVLAPHSDLYDTARRMSVAGVRSLPVLQDGRIVGVVSRADLLRVLAREDDEIEADVHAALELEFGAHVPCQVQVEDGVVTLSLAPPGPVVDAAGLDGVVPTGATQPGAALGGAALDGAVLDGAVLVAERVPGVVRVHAVTGG